MDVSGARCGLPLWSYSEFGIEFGGFVEDSIFHYYDRLSYVADVGCRVAVDQYQIGQLAGRDGAEIFIHAHDAGCVERGILQDDVGGNSGLDVDFKLTVKSESCHVVGTVFDGEAGAVEKSFELEHLGERFLVGFFHAFGRRHSGGEQAAADLRGQTIGDWAEANRNFSGRGHVLIFKDRHGEIEFGVMLLQKLDEGLDLRRVEVE